jgi:hypothetical protein
MSFSEFKKDCPHKLTPADSRRPGNALNVEIPCSPSERCRLKIPENWPDDSHAARWINSGGSELVFGACSQPCGLGQEWCPDCGHRRESHLEHLKSCCPVHDRGFPCGCEYYNLLKVLRKPTECPWL